MTHLHDDTDPIEHDPTGMRALLGSLPDPAPMPADLVIRIEEALADEARIRGGWPAPVAAEAEPPVSAVPADPEGQVLALRRRSRWHLVAVAAAVVGVVGIGGAVLDSLSSGGLQASIGVEDSAAGGSAADGSVPEVAEAAPRTLLAEDDELGVVVLEGGQGFTSAGLADEVRASLPWDGTGRPASPGPSKDSPQGVAPRSALGPLGTAEGARSCADGVGVPPTDTVVVDLADVDGRPAAVLVATSKSGSRQVWAVARTCTAQSPGVLTGPVPVA